MPVTPCPDIDRLVDDAAAGLPGADARLDAHAAACAACLAEAEALDDGLGDALACLRDEACPPDVLAAVFAEVSGRTRPAPPLAADRAPRPATRPARRRVWAGVLVAAALVALTTLWPRPEVPLVAVATPAEAPVGAPPVEIPTETPSAEPTPVEAPTEARPAPRATAPRRAPRRAAAPRPATPRRAAPEPAAPTERLDPPANLAEAPTEADTAAAQQDLLLALRIVARAQRRADAAVQTEMNRVSTALEPAQLLQ